MFYNFLRFKNLLETGYSYNINILFPSYPDFSSSLRHGLFSIYHIPRNLYYPFFKGPDLLFDPKTGLAVFPYLTVDPWGLSIFYTSPLFLFPLFPPGFKLKDSYKEIITILLILLPTVTYFGVGYAQFGYRYAMDFYPFLLLLLLKSLRGKLLLRHKILIIIGVFFNLFFMVSIWGAYPFINF